MTIGGYRFGTRLAQGLVKGGEGVSGMQTVNLEVRLGYVRKDVP
ncbi:MAG: hypothetical protein BROFUL_00576 [Candidatus Brocadia fulgida]|uniref:Uncharacterized protein n=1 Tax=Candidatus Brocadia fulgida TaxID=380242 RepID=A0A0M2UX91_9BACT|nr:MAG: hypothetical protein BROFUL_00576 [Candidatus Brocadia fulgida]